MRFNDLAVRGIDISGYNGAIDWAKVKASSHFVIIRAGYGNTTDKTFLANWKNASVPKAAYWYMDYYSNWYNKESKAYGLSDVAFGLLQANYCWELLKGDPGGSIVWLDIESGGADYSPNITSSPAAGHAQAIAKAFLMEMDRLNGRKNGIYCSVGLLTWFDKWFRDRPLWVAWYTKTQTVDSVLKAVRARGWEGDTLMWQYASDGDVDEDGKGDGKQLGSSYNWLDLNVWVGDADDWLEWKHGGVITPPEPVPEPSPIEAGQVVKTLVNLNIRKGAGVGYGIWATAPKGTKLNVLEIKGDWVRVGWNQWCMSKYNGVRYLNGA